MSWLDEAENAKNSERKKSADFKLALEKADTIAKRIESVVNVFDFDFTFNDKAFCLSIRIKSGIYEFKGEQRSSIETRAIKIFHNSSEANSMFFESEVKSSYFDVDDDDSGCWRTYTSNKNMDLNISITTAKLATLSELNWVTIFGWLLHKTIISELKQYLV